MKTLEKKPSAKSELVRNELMRLTREGDGKLSPAKVVDAARPDDSLLHHLFEWDDSEAAEQYRVWQARQLISVQVTYLPHDEREIRVFASVSNRTEETEAGDFINSDRRSYVPINIVMRDPGMRGDFLDQCKKDAKAFMAKYQHLSECADVIAAIRRLTV